jgi:hypothetical protein
MRHTVCCTLIQHLSCAPGRQTSILKIDSTQITLGKEVWRALRSTSTSRSNPGRWHSTHQKKGNRPPCWINVCGYMYICKYVYVYIHVHTHIFIYIYAHTHIFMCMYKYVYIYILYVCVHIYV